MKKVQLHTFGVLEESISVYRKTGFTACSRTNCKWQANRALWPAHCFMQPQLPWLEGKEQRLDSTLHLSDMALQNSISQIQEQGQRNLIPKQALLNRNILCALSWRGSPPSRSWVPPAFI